MKKLFFTLWMLSFTTLIQAQKFNFKATTVYQIYPRSFFDTNGDGIGDIKGIIAKLNYIQWLGFESIWISPFFQSPQQDLGYDISNFVQIAPEYGTMEDVENLIAEVHSRGMKIVFDMVMNHTSSEHHWFQKSSQVSENEYSDFYVWRKGRGKNGNRPPNNWKAMIGGTGWQYHPERQMWYWACFLPFQPDLNYHNPAVKDTMLNTVRFWLDKGVDGFRLDIFNAIFEDEKLRNNPFSLKMIPSEKNSNGFFQKQIYNLNHPENYAFAKELRQVVDEYPDKFLVGEVFGTMDQILEYTGKSNDGLNLVFLFKSLSTPLKASKYRKLVQEYEHYFGEPNFPTWVVGNHDRFRRISVLGNSEAKMKLSTTLQFTLRGTPFTYYGEEIGMKQAKISSKNAIDPLGKKYKLAPRFLIRMTKNSLNRDECRTPMQWNAQENAGFSSNATTWLPVNDDYRLTNVQNQMENPSSILNHYQSILKVRNQHPALQTGSYEEDHNLSKGKIFAYTRQSNNETILVIHNFGKKSKNLKLPTNTQIIFATDNIFEPNKIKPYQSLIFIKN